MCIIRTKIAWVQVSIAEVLVARIDEGPTSKTWRLRGGNAATSIVAEEIPIHLPVCIYVTGTAIRGCRGVTRVGVGGRSNWVCTLVGGPCRGNRATIPCGRLGVVSYLTHTPVSKGPPVGVSRRCISEGRALGTSGHRRALRGDGFLPVT